MAKRLEKIPGLRYSMYADDIILWATTGSEGDIEETLRAVADVVTECSGAIGLSCSPQKSELLVIRSSYVLKTPQPDIIVLVDDVPVPEVQTLSVLGMHIQNNGRNSVTINKLIGCVNHMNRLIRRIANKHVGMKEADIKRLIQAFVLSRIVYSLPYLHLQYTEREKVGDSSDNRTNRRYISRGMQQQKNF